MEQKKKKNVFVRFFQAIGNGIKNFFCWLAYLLIFLVFHPQGKCKVVGKENINKNDEAKVFIANHYELYGPVAMYLHFPLKFRPWIIDKMMEPSEVKQQMSLMVMNNFPKFPIWFKKMAIAVLKNVVVFTMNHAKGISCSRENARANIKTINTSIETLEKGVSIAIFPEHRYVTEGVGEFETGFEYLAKAYHKKTGKKIAFYPVFISQINKEMYVEKPIIYNPENDTQEEKNRIVSYLRNTMLQSFETHELKNPIAITKKEKIKEKQEQEKQKKLFKEAKKQQKKDKKEYKKEIKKEGK